MRQNGNLRQRTNKVYQIEREFLERAGVKDYTLKQHHELRDSHLKELGEIRKELDKSLKPITRCMNGGTIKPIPPEQEIQFCKEMQTITADCNSKMIEFCHHLVSNAKSVMGKPPCEFEVVAMGSIARGEMTPFSDLEFLLLVETETKGPYFVNLSIFIYLLINNLGETNLKCFNVQELKTGSAPFQDHRSNGFKFDGITKNSGNIPTGNGLENSKKLILTPSELLENYRRVYENSVEEESTLVGSDISQMLYNLVSIYKTKESLLEQFQEGALKLSINEKRVEKTLFMMKQDSERYKYTPRNFRDQSGWLKVKDDIYRYPTLVTNSLKILFEIHEANVWKASDKLGTLLQWAEPARHALKVLISVSLYARLATYLYYNKQEERITLLGQKCAGKHKSFDFPLQIFQVSCHYLIPFKELVAEKLSDANTFNYQEKFFHVTMDTSLYINLISYAYCHQWEHCLHAYESLTGTDISDATFKSVEDVDLLDIIGYCNYKLGKHELSLAACARICTLTNTGSALMTLTAYNHMACSLRYIAKYPEALRYHQVATRMFLKNFGKEPHPELARTHNFVARNYSDWGKYCEAEQYHEKARIMLIELYGKDSNHPHIAHCYNNIGNTYNRKGEYERADDFLRRTLEIRMVIHGQHSDHQDIAIALHNIADNLMDMDKPGEASVCYKQALDMYLRIYGDSDHSEIAAIYHKLPVSMGRGEMEPTKTQMYFVSSLAMLNRLYSNTPMHPQIADYYKSLAIYEMTRTNYGDSLEHIDTALQIYHDVYASKAHINIVSCYVKKAIALEHSHRLGESYNQLLLAAKALKAIFGDHPQHPNYAICLNKMATMKRSECRKRRHA